MLFTNALQTNRQTDQPTDTAYYRDSRTHLKTAQENRPSSNEEEEEKEEQEEEEEEEEQEDEEEEEENELENKSTRSTRIVIRDYEEESRMMRKGTLSWKRMTPNRN